MDTPTPEGPSLWTLAQQIVAFVIALGVVYVTVLRPVARKLADHFREAIERVIDAQRENGEKLERVDHQLHPNGGASAHDYARKAADGVARLEVQQHAQARQISGLRRDYTDLATELRTHLAMSAVDWHRAQEALDQQGITLPDPVEVKR